MRVIRKDLESNRYSGDRARTTDHLLFEEIEDFGIVGYVPDAQVDMDSSEVTEGGEDSFSFSIVSVDDPAEKSVFKIMSRVFKAALRDRYMLDAFPSSIARRLVIWIRWKRPMNRINGPPFLKLVFPHLEHAGPVQNIDCFLI